MISYPNVKINLGLSVLRKRPDGYHDLETLFVPYFGIRDELEIVEAGEFGIEVVRPVSGGFAPCPWDPMTDLTAKAWRLLSEEFGIPPVRIRLVKNAPVGAGLGGGSADGAFALRMLSEMFSLGLSDAQMAGFAARLGSDCAFFIYNRPMFGEGRGDVLTPYDLDLSGFDIEVVVPDGIAVCTAEAYRGIVPRESAGEGCRLRSGSRSALIPPGLPAGPLPFTKPRVATPPEAYTPAGLLPLRKALAAGPERWREVLVNDFEATVFAAHPQLAAIKASLYERGAIYASMSGSGSAVFGLHSRPMRSEH